MKRMLAAAATVTALLCASAAMAADAAPAVHSPRLRVHRAQHSRAIAYVRSPTYYARPVYYRPYPYFGRVFFGLSVGPDWAW